MGLGEVIPNPHSAIAYPWDEIPCLLGDDLSCQGSYLVQAVGLTVGLTVGARNAPII